MSDSTKVILNKLLQTPLIRGQLPSSFAKQTTDSNGGNSSDRYNVSTSATEDGRSDDVLQLRIKDPKLAPAPKPKLTIAEEKQLDREFVLVQHMLHKFKEILRQEGRDVSSLYVSKQNGRISYNLKEYSNRFQVFMTNKIVSVKQPIDTRESEPSFRRGMK